MSEIASLTDYRGRDARAPGEIPKAGWRDILLRVKNKIGSAHVTLVAASIAFYGLLALFPAIAATIGVGGLLLEPQQIEQPLQSASALLPEEAATIILDQTRKVTSTAGGGIALAAIGGLLFALYSASKAMRALIEGLNIIYHEDEKRGFIKLNLIGFALTLGLILVMVVALGLIAVAPAVLAVLGLGTALEWLVSLSRWPILFIVAMIGLAIIYRYGPSRARPRWQWISWGAVLGTLTWVLGSAAFSIYVRNFASYNETYGSLGAVIILLMWFWLSAFIVLMGAALNAEIEHQTARDSTLGPPKPMGDRGAHVADTLGEVP